jgi:predicted metal-dependent phosphoesterase TrpH
MAAMQRPITELNADLHSHSTVSDGLLAPRELVQRAAAQGVELLALTDHDELGGLAAATASAAEIGLPFVPGVEISVTWAGRTVHVVGLGIDAADQALRAGLATVRSGRTGRAREMAAELARAGIDGAFEGALRYAGNPDLISRTHFARYLVERGICGSPREVFARYLVEGKPGYVPHCWAQLAAAVRWIVSAGGVAVIAHPGRYRFSEDELSALVAEFRDLGGAALEVATSNHGVAETQRFAQLALEFGLAASRGSDFHGPGESHAELGQVGVLPYRLAPVWERLRF